MELYQDSLNDLCKFLFDNTEITYFSHTRINKNLEFFGLSSDYKFTRHYLDKQYYNNDIHLLNFSDDIKYIHWDLINRKGKTSAMHADFAAFNYGHTFTIIESLDNFKDCYHFATDLNNLSINNKYYRYTELLEKFILYFKEQVSKDKQLREIYKSGYKIDSDNNCYDCEDLSINNTSPYTNPNSLVLNIENNLKLTRREIECMYWLGKGKTMQEIAIILKITHRTVRAHIEYCKIKLNCKNLFQLGSFSSNFNMKYVMNQMD